MGFGTLVLVSCMEGYISIGLSVSLGFMCVCVQLRKDRIWISAFYLKTHSFSNGLSRQLFSMA